jgi:hypothetical protein
MQTFLDTCQKLGLDQQSVRGQKLRASIPAQLSDSCLFLICGYDFIQNPNDMKFRGIEQLFVRPQGPFALNLGQSCIADFQNTATNPAVNASVEGTSWMGQPGKKVNFNTALMAKPAGVRDGGAGNYNLQTKALELIVTHGDGLARQSTLSSEIVPKLQFAFAKPPAPLGEITKATLAEMRAALSPFWGASTMMLGL